MAIEELGHRPALTCVNHNPTAIATHTVNHPWARHYCTGVDDLNLNSMFGDTILDILWSSPSCVSHSTARGGTPVNEQDRATAWCVVRIAETLKPPVILIENVSAFKKWCPTTRKWNKKLSRWELHPDKSREGETFEAWLGALRSLGYKVDHRVLCCADYGDPTTRERLFIQCVHGSRRKIVWPNPTHGSPERLREAKDDLFGIGEDLQPWVPAKDIIDWSLEGTSIFHRKKPLVEKTLRRIFLGLDRIGLKGPGQSPKNGKSKSYLVRQMGQSHGEDVHKPLSAVVGGPKHHLADAFLTKLRGTSIAASVDKPSPTITGGGTHLGICETTISALLPQQSAGILRHTEEPTPTVAGSGAISIITAKTTKMKGRKRQNPVLVQLNHVDKGDSQPDSKSSRIRAVEDTFPTICGNRGEWSLLEAHLVPNFGERDNQDPRTHSVGQPLPAVTGHGAGGLVQGQVRPVDKNSKGLPPSNPIQEMVGEVIKKLKLRNFQFHGQWHENGCPLIEIAGEIHILDIEFRMLQPHELAAAQGFPKGYTFEGTKTEVIKQIGNAVPCNTARALVKAALTQDPNVGLPNPPTDPECLWAPMARAELLQSQAEALVA